MVSVEWTDMALAERNGVRTLDKHEVVLSVGDTDVDEYRVEMLPDTAVGYRTSEPALVCIENVMTPETRFTEEAARTSWDVYNRAEENLLNHAIKHNATVKREPQRYRLVLRTIQSSTTGESSQRTVDVPSDIGIVKEKRVHNGWTFVAQDGAGGLHLLTFSQPDGGSKYSLKRAQTPYSLASERTLYFSFEVVRAGQQRLHEKGEQVAQNGYISFSEQPQVRVADEELDAAEDWVDHTKLQQTTPSP